MTGPQRQHFEVGTTLPFPFYAFGVMERVKVLPCWESQEARHLPLVLTPSPEWSGGRKFSLEKVPNQKWDNKKKLTTQLGGGNSHIFYFHPHLGK